MAFRIAQNSMAPVRKGGPKKEADYLSFIHMLPCCLSGATAVEAAHISTENLAYGHVGRGKGQKAPDRWVLPLRPDLHHHQHQIGEKRFWREHQKDPYVLALIIWGLWTEMGVYAQPFALNAITSWRAR